MRRGCLFSSHRQMSEQAHATNKVTVLEIAWSMASISLGQRNNREGHALGEVAVIFDFGAL